jgi:hypothetical protein
MDDADTITATNHTTSDRRSRRPAMTLPASAPLSPGRSINASCSEQRTNLNVLLNVLKRDGKT